MLAFCSSQTANEEIVRREKKLTILKIIQQNDTLKCDVHLCCSKRNRKRIVIVFRNREVANLLSENVSSCNFTSKLSNKNCSNEKIRVKLYKNRMKLLDNSGVQFCYCWSDVITTSRCISNSP